MEWKSQGNPPIERFDCDLLDLLICLLNALLLRLLTLFALSTLWKNLKNNLFVFCSQRHKRNA